MTALGEPRSFANAAGVAALYDHGAHLVHWQPQGVEPVLWMSDASALDDAAPIRGGVPICFPWFGAGRTGDQAPVHGFARIRPWTLDAVTEEPASTRLTYQLDIDPSEAFPHRLRAAYAITFGETLELTLTVTNRGGAEASFEEALHTYFAVSDIHQVRVLGLDGATYLDKSPAGAGALVTQSGDVTFAGETDRVYSASTDVTIVDPGLHRSIVVSKQNSANTVVWNPWVAKSAAMPDFGDDEWPGMLCVEGANVGANAIVLAPGASHTMTYRVQVLPLA